MIVEMYTDGAVSGNPGCGGFAAILIARDGQTIVRQRVIYGYSRKATNNQMELMAAVAGLETLKKRTALTIYTDSEYLQRGITQWLPGWMQKNWRTASGQPVKNQDLWKRLLSLRSQHNVDWQWVKGHADNPYNELADKWAVLAKTYIRDGHIWCQWCGDVMAEINTPCRGCSRLGATTDPDVSFWGEWEAEA